MADLDTPSENPFDQLDATHIAGMGARADAAQQEPPNPFDDLDIGQHGRQVSTLGAVATGAAESAIPSVAGLAGAGYGAALGEAIFPFGGGIVGGIAGALGGGYLAGKGQDYAVKSLPNDWRDPIEETEEAAQEQHPYASFLGGLVPMALTMSPRVRFSGKPPPPNATTMQRIMANPATARLFGGAIQGAMELGQEKAEGQDADWAKVAASTAFGLIFNKTNKFIGERIEGAGARLAPGAGLLEHARVAPTINDAQDVKVAGPGIDEAVSQGQQLQDPAAEEAARAAKQTEAVLLGEKSAEVQPDAHAIARQMEPELFHRWDTLEGQADALRQQIDEYNAPPQRAFDALDDQRQSLEAQLADEKNKAAQRRLRAQIRDVQSQSDVLAARRDAFAAGTLEETPERAEMRSRLLDVDEERRVRGREVAAAYRRAAERRTHIETVQPEGEFGEGASAGATPPEAPTPPAAPTRAPEQDTGREPVATAEPGAQVPERIQSAAVKIAGRTFSGRTHHDAMVAAEAATGRPMEQLIDETEKADGDADGFLTSQGRYVSRAEAAEIANKADQVQEKSKGGAPERFVAEDLKGNEGVKLPVKSSREQIAEDVTRQMVALGVSPEKAEARAHLESAFFSTLASRTKAKFGSALDLYEKHGILWRRGEPTPPATPAPKAEKPPEPEPVALGGQKVSGPLADKLRVMIAKAEEKASAETSTLTPTETASVQNMADRAGEPVVIGEDETISLGGEKITGKLAEKLKAMAQAAKAKEAAPVEGEKVLFQPRKGGRTPQGAINIVEGQRPVVDLFKDADFSTLIHEGAHNYLDIVERYAAHADAPPELAADLRTVKRWAGIGADDPIKTKEHEKFARAFERYIREGVAPSRDLAGIFARFKQWMLQIYESAKSLGKPLSPEIRGVFDRLLSDEQHPIVIAPEIERGRALADIHEAEVRETPPGNAIAVADRIAAERMRHANEPPPEIAHEIAQASEAQAAEQQAAVERPGEGEPGGSATADAAGATGPSVEGRGALGSASGEAGAKPGGGDVGVQSGAERAGGGGAQTKGASGQQPGRGGAGSSGVRPSEPGPSDNAGNTVPWPTPRQPPGGERPTDDLAANIRTKNLTSVPEVMAELKASAARNNDFAAQRRGPTDGQVLDAAVAAGMQGAERIVANHIRGQALNETELMTLRVAIERLAEEEHLAAKAFGESPAIENAVEYAKASDRLDMTMAVLTEATARWGRSGRALRNISQVTDALRQRRAAAGEPTIKTAGLSDDQIIQQLTGKTLFQLKAQAEAVSRADGVEQIAKLKNEFKKPTWGEMLLEHLTNGWLSGIPSHITYGIANVLRAAQGVAETSAAAAISAARGRVAGERVYAGEAGQMAGAGLRAIPSALLSAGQSFKAGATSLLPGEKSHLPAFQQRAGSAVAAQPIVEGASWHDLSQASFATMQGLMDGFKASNFFVGKDEPRWGARPSNLGAIPDLAAAGLVVPWGTLERLPSRAVGAFHTFFRVIFYSMEKSALAYRDAADQGLSGQAMADHISDRMQATPETMMRSAADAATQAALMGQGGAFTKALGRFTNTAIDLPVLGPTRILKFIDPFVRVSSNVIEQSLLQRTPLGVFSREVMRDLRGENGAISQDKAMARMGIGLATCGLFGTLASMGYASGSGPSDPKKAAMWRLTGNQAHSVRIGDMWYDTHRLGAMGMQMSVAADMFDVVHAASSGHMLEAASSLWQAVTQNILDESFMRGPSDLVKALDEPDRYGQVYLQNWVKSLVPYNVGLGYMDRATDPYTRQARSVSDSIKRVIPGLSETLFPRRDIWGQQLPNPEALIGAGVTTLYEHRMNRDPVNLALWNLGIYPGQLKRDIRNVQLDDGQYDDFQRIAGRMAKMRLDAIVGSDQFASWPTNVQHDVLSTTITQSRETARGVMMMKYPSIMREATEAKQKKAMGQR